MMKTFTVAHIVFNEFFFLLVSDWYSLQKKKKKCKEYQCYMSVESCKFENVSSVIGTSVTFSSDYNETQYCNLVEQNLITTFVWCTLVIYMTT